MNKLRQAISALLYTEPFYGHLISKMRISKSEEVPSAGVFITDKINLVYNETWIESLDILDVAKVLKHECSHILQEHISRSKQIGIKSKEAHKRFNLATDVTINIKDLKPTVEKIGGVTVSKLNEMMQEIVSKSNKEKNQNKKFTPMLEGQIAEYYYNKINEFAEENADMLPEGGVGDTLDDHSVWEKSEGSSEMHKEVTKQVVNDAVKSCGGIGSIPSDVLEKIAKLNKSQVNWKKQLRQFFVNSLKTDSISTRKKRNRRYGILQPGVKKKPNLHLGLCVDTSGSISNKELSLFWSEISEIYKNNVKITVIEADSKIQNVYEFDPSKTPEFKGRGGTSYSEPIKHAKNLNVDGIIYFGDGDASDTPENPKIPFLWALVRNSPAPANFGKVIRIVNNESNY